MQIETALKNYVLETVVCSVNSDSFIDVYSNLLDNYKMFSTAGKSFPDARKREQAEDKYKRELKRRLDLRNRIYKVQTDAFGNGNKIAEHYLNKDVNLPIWAIFELLSLGEFGHFVSCLNFSCRQAISAKIGIRKSDDNNAMMPQRLIYATKDLRNAIAHNDVIFDTRFRTGNIDKQVCNAISNATGVVGLNFETITDYVVLVVYQLSLLHISKNDMKRLITSFVECTEKLRKAIPTSVYNQIIRTDNNSKIAALRKFI
jgi:abortive infection bacteriophage resistance protein